MPHNQAAFLVLIPHWRRIVERTEPSICKPKTDNAWILKVGEVLVVEVGETRLYISDVAKKPIKDVDEVGELGEECTSV